MKKIITAAAMCCTALAGAMSTPALANPAPIHDTTGLTPQEVCDAQLKPNDPNSDFQTVPQSVVAGGWTTVNTNITDPAGAPYGIGTLVYTDITAGASGGFFRNGGSPNVWGTATAAGSYYPQTGQLFHTTLDQQRTVTFNCYVFKIVGHNNNLVDPAGLQSTGNSTLEEQTIPGSDTLVVTNDHFPGSGGGQVNTLICISPNTGGGKPGAWKYMHGFTGNCTAASTAAGTTFIPSNNNPIAG